VSTALTELNNPLQSTATVPSRSAALDLNIRQKSFVDNLMQLKVGWKAAEAAGYSGDNATLRSTASDLLTNPNVRAYYEERLAEMAVSSTEVLAELGEIARWNLSDEKSPVRAADKLKALELAGKYHRLFVDRVETEAHSDPSRLAGDLTAVLGVVREAIEAYRVATAAQMDPVDQVGQGATESGDGLAGPSSSLAPIIDVTPRMDQQQQQLGPVDHARSSPSPLSSSQPIINPTPTHNGEDGP
jgi:hypothetical protein